MATLNKQTPFYSLSPVFYNRIYLWYFYNIQSIFIRLCGFTEFERQILLTSNLPSVAKAFVHMSKQKSLLGSHTKFMLSKDKQFSPENIKSYSILFTSPELNKNKDEKHQSEQILLSNTQIINIENSLISINLEILKNAAKFMTILKQISNNKCFRSHRENPSIFADWLDPKNGHSISEFLAAYFEKILIEHHNNLYLKSAEFIKEYMKPLKEQFLYYQKLHKIFDIENSLPICFIPLENASPEFCQITNHILSKFINEKSKLSEVKKEDILKEISEIDEYLINQYNLNNEKIQNEDNKALENIKQNKNERKSEILQNLLNGIKNSMNYKEKIEENELDENLDKELYDQIREIRSKLKPRIEEKPQIIEIQKPVEISSKIIQEVASENLSTSKENRNDQEKIPEIKKAKPKQIIPRKDRLVINTPYLDYLQQSDFFANLESEINQKVSEIDTFTKEMYEDAIKVKEIVQKTARETFKNESVHCEMYGSLATGLSLETSDADIAVCGLKIPTKSDMVTFMYTLSENLKTNKIIENCQVIETARVPVIKLVFLT